MELLSNEFWLIIDQTSQFKSGLFVTVAGESNPIYRLITKQLKRDFPYFILTDLDKDVCTPHLIEQWFKKTPIHTNLFFRVAVREVESWIMADRENFAQFLGIPLQKIDSNTDSILDPKQTICNWARKSRKKEIRVGIPPKNDFAVQGVEYVVRIVHFINNVWNVANATESSPSLNRTVERLQNWLK